MRAPCLPDETPSVSCRWETPPRRFPVSPPAFVPNCRPALRQDWQMRSELAEPRALHSPGVACEAQVLMAKKWGGSPYRTSKLWLE
jgi:hypothetical protein